MSHPSVMEHPNRKIVSDIDDLFVILDPSSKSLKHIARIKDITHQIGIRYGHLYLVGNYDFDETAEEYLGSSGEAYLGKIEYDADIQEYNLPGKSLLELPEDAPKRRRCLFLLRMQPLVKRLMGLGATSTLGQIETVLKKGNGFWILTRLTTPGVPIVKPIPVPLYLWRTGLKCHYMLVKKTTIYHRQANDRR